MKSMTYKSMPWKNGAGTTQEIAIEPADANFSNNDFLWRISSATIESTNKFSTFDGYDRILLVIKGDGLFLNKFRVTPFMLFEFTGETRIDCELVKDPVIDLGLIFDRKRIAAQIKIHNWQQAVMDSQIKTQKGTSYLFCAQGAMTIGDHKLEMMDCLKVEGEQRLNVTCTAPAIVIQMHFSARAREYNE